MRHHHIHESRRRKPPRASSSYNARAHACESVPSWKRLFGECILRRPPSRFPISDGTSSSVFHPVSRWSSLFLGVSRFLRNSSAEDTKAFSAIIGITAGLKFRFRLSGTNCVNLRQYAIRSCLRFPANKFTSESGGMEHWSLGGKQRNAGYRALYRYDVHETILIRI